MVPRHELDLLDRVQEPSVALKDFASGVVSSLDAQGHSISMGGAEKVFRVLSKGLDVVDIGQKVAEGDLSAAAAVLAGSAINAFVSGVLTGLVVAAGVVT